MSAKQQAVIDRIRTARERRDQAIREFNTALVAAERAKKNGQPRLTWREIGRAAGMTPQGVIATLRRIEARRAR